MRNYPGKAVDATLTMDQSSAMGVLYEANWINAHESIKLPSRFYNQKNSNGISSLGNYQRTLEQIKAIEDKSKDENITKTIRELSGYKPSTLRRKNRRQYVEWDGMKDGDVKEKIKNTETGIKSVSQTAEYNTYNNSNGTKKDKNLKNDKGLRRSQTVIIQDGTLDVKDLFQRKQKLKQQQLQLNCDKSGYVNVINKNSNKFCDVNKKLHDYEVIDDFESNSHDYEPVVFKNNIKNNQLTENRMSSYTEPILISSIKDKKINPVSRNKSVRINSVSPQKIENGASPKSIELSPTKTKKDETPRSGLKKLIYNTISAGTKYPKEFLKHINSSNNGVGGGNDTPQLNDSKLNSHSPTRLTTIVSGTTPPSRKPGSSSSQDSDDFFSIPRPRLIVPVHTYARKRRTGNLVADQVETLKNEEDEDKGMICFNNCTVRNCGVFL